MDLFIWQGVYRLRVDGTRIDGATDTYLRRALAVPQPLHGVEEAERENHKRYPTASARLSSSLSLWEHRSSSEPRRGRSSASSRNAQLRAGAQASLRRVRRWRVRRWRGRRASLGGRWVLGFCARQAARGRARREVLHARNAETLARSHKAGIYRKKNGVTTATLAHATASRADKFLGHGTRRDIFSLKM